MTATACRYRVRWPVPDDEPAMLAIERASFPDPWTEAALRAQLRKRNCIGYVAETPDDRIVGFLMYELEADGLRVVNVAVDPAARFSGVGTVLVAKVRGKLEGHRRRWVSATVNERNAAAVGLFRSCGFTARLAPGEYGADDGIEFVYRDPGRV